MGMPPLSLSLAADGREVASVPLAPVLGWFWRLCSSNEEFFAREDDPELRPCRVVRVICPDCSAPVFCLTSIETASGAARRACRRCGSSFPADQ